MMKLPTELEIRKYIGQRIRARRRALNMTQPQLAEKLNLTRQQVQKYEMGLDRISAERLYEIAIVLDTSPVQFFPACDGSSGGGGSANEFSEWIGRQDIARLLRGWRILKTPQRSLLIDMIEGTGQQLIKKAAAMSGSSSQPTGHHHQ